MNGLTFIICTFACTAHNIDIGPTQCSVPLQVLKRRSLTSSPDFPVMAGPHECQFESPVPPPPAIRPYSGRLSGPLDPERWKTGDDVTVEGDCIHVRVCDMDNSRPPGGLCLRRAQFLLWNRGVRTRGRTRARAGRGGTLSTERERRCAVRASSGCWQGSCLKATIFRQQGAELLRDAVRARPN